MKERMMLEEDVKLICVEAMCFPYGIRAAFSRLENEFADVMNRDFFGISYKTKEGSIIYKAAVRELREGEATKAGFETFVIPSAEYLSETIFEWKKNVESIGKAFDRLLAQPCLDTDFPCIEWYKSLDEVICMIKIKNHP